MTWCVADNPNGESEPHLAHVEVLDCGGVWTPSCSDRVLDWWSTDSGQSVRDRLDAGAPDAWIRPLGGPGPVRMAVADLTPGMMVDLKGDPFLRDLDESDRITIENIYGEVGGIVIETPECTMVDFPNVGFGIGWPPLYVVTVHALPDSDNS